MPLFCLSGLRSLSPGIGGCIDLLTQRVGALEERLKESDNVDSRIAVVETIVGTPGQMVVALQKEVHELRHGLGFVQRRSQDGVDGEYL